MPVLGVVDDNFKKSLDKISLSRFVSLIYLSFDFLLGANQSVLRR